MNKDTLIYSVENVLEQSKNAPLRNGVYELRFYTKVNRPAKEKTDKIETFYFYPSGGTIRDRDLNIVFYEPRLDRHKNFRLRRPGVTGG
jgi:hypothetical protein